MSSTELATLLRMYAGSMALNTWQITVLVIIKNVKLHTKLAKPAHTARSMTLSLVATNPEIPTNASSNILYANN